METPDGGWFSAIRLAEGFSVHVLPTRKFKLLTARLLVRLPLRAPEVTASALVPFVLRRGTRRLPSTQAIARELQAMAGARLSTEVTKVGEVQLVEVRADAVADRYLPGAQGGNGQLEAMLRLVFETLLDPLTEGATFSPAYVSQERELLRRRIEGIINNKRQYAIHRLFEEMFAGEPFALSRLGRLADLASLDPAGVYRHYRDWMLRHPIDLIVVGDVSPEKVADLAARHVAAYGERFTGGDGSPAAAAPGGGAGHGSIPAGPPGRTATPANGRWRQVTEAQDVRQGIVALGLRTPVRFASPEYPALMMYNGMLGGFPHSRLFVQVRERHSLAYFVYSRLEPTKGVLVVSAGIDPGRKDQVIAIIEEQLAATARGQMTAEEIDATRKGIVRRLLVSEDDPGSLIDHYVTELVNGIRRPLPELLRDVERVQVEAMVEVAGRLEPQMVYFLTARPGDGVQQPASAAALEPGGTEQPSEGRS